MNRRMNNMTKRKSTRNTLILIRAYIFNIIQYPPNLGDYMKQWNFCNSQIFPHIDYKENNIDEIEKETTLLLLQKWQASNSS